MAIKKDTLDGLWGGGSRRLFPPTIVQTCIVHLIRNSMDFASWKDRKPIAAELKAIYRATDTDVHRRALEDSTPASGAASIRQSRRAGGASPSPTQSVNFTSNVIAPALISAFNRAM